MPESEQPAIHVPICAIGASAGGVNALRQLFHELPDDLGLAYVVIVHLAPDYPSALPEILSKCTEMQVHQVTDEPKLQPNCIYVIPPDRELVIQGDQVSARNFVQPRGQRAPIDVFFRSVANARGDGMAVVLSGSGADGASGVQAFKEAGGIVFAQDPNEAEFSAMPRNAIATGIVDFIAPLSQLAERIVEVAKSKEAVRSLDQDASSNQLRRIIEFLRGRTGHDFSGYKRATVMRRVLRRMQVCRLDDLDQYGNLVRTTPEEAQALFEDLLISVTQFFRDGDAYDALEKKVIAPLFEDPGDDGIRIWSVGCATGEEAYSLAILVLEEAQRRKTKVPVQIFASDLDEGALGTAREGRYPLSIAADVSEGRLQQFFIAEGTHYRVRKEVRDLVVFASHSVLKDPPFLRLDLVACRNLMIYLERQLQAQMLELFHYSLRPNGYLFLGSAETADVSPEFFTSIEREARIYTARPHAQRRIPLLTDTSSHYRFAGPSQQPEARRHDRDYSAAKLHMEALEQFAPPSILVDDAQHLLHISPTAGRFIQHSAGAFSNKLPSVVRPELRSPLQIWLDRALQHKISGTTDPVTVALNGSKHRISLYVAPVSGQEKAGAQVLVLFLDAGPAPADTDEISDAGDNSTSEEVRHLHAQLRSAQDAVLLSRTEYETAIEQLRAANEELQSINEEYRSTSEELETSKEELQSMNEELNTVNSELKTKLESISTAHSDLQNLTSATEIGTLFLDSRLKIRMFTPPTAELFNITDMDVGRSITDFTHRLRYDGLEQDAQTVLRHLTPVEKEVQSHDGRGFMMRLRPYRTVEDRIAGVVATFVNITARLHAERQLLESERRYRMLFDAIDEGFTVIEVLFDDDGRPVDYRFLDVNDAFERQTGLKDAIGRTAREMIPAHEKHWFEIYGRIATTGEAERFEAPAEALDRFYEAYAFPIEANGKHNVGVLFRDISERKEAEAQREMLTRELSHRVKNSLAVVQALARQPGAAELTVDEYRKRFVGRIQALARAHDQLLETNWQSADLKALIESTLAPYGKIGHRSLVIDGPPVRLPPKKGLGIALVLHELATNASKYGSLSAENGELRVTWDISPQRSVPHVFLRWEERGGPPVKADTEKGFGSKLIERVCTYELEGPAHFQFEPDGLKIDITFPNN
ncbi:MAG: PAS domain-containing protein [Alphaproteobacteria bacterium]|nr:PAS domain-containing protein [Alphaproteobacteria bacterium]